MMFFSRLAGRGALGIAVLALQTASWCRAGSPPQGVPFWSEFQRVAGPRAVERAAQIRQESAFDPSAVSWVGARGIAQFMPATWSQWGQGKDPFDPHAGIYSQHLYMNHLEARTREWTGALAAYNWGRVDRIRKAQLQAESLGLPAREWRRFLKIPTETEKYINRIQTVHVPWVKAQVGGI